MCCRSIYRGIRKKLVANDEKIVVPSISFSRDPYLKETLLQAFPHTLFNTKGIRLQDESLREFLKDADGAIIGAEQIDDAILSKCPRLKIVSKYGVGLDNIDQSACEKFGVRVGWTGGTNRLSVAEQTLGFMLSLARNLYQSSLLLKSGQWAKTGGFQLSGKTVGIIGVGCIGKEVVRLLQPFNCTILVNDILDQTDYYKANDLIPCSKERIFSGSDIVTIHTPLTEQTRYLVDKTALSLMKKTAFLINTSRGSVVKQNDLRDALQQGSIAGAALDVFEEEPPTDRELLSLPNLFCTPHIGGNAAEAVRAMGLSAIEHLQAFYPL